MKFAKIDKTLAADLIAADNLTIVYEDGDDTYLLGTVMTNHSMSLDEALELIGWDEETMDEMTAELGWSGWDYEAITDIWNPAEYLREKGFCARKARYCANNAYTYVLLYDANHAEVFYMDGSDDMPIINAEWIEAHPEYEAKCGKLSEGQTAYYAPAIAAAAMDYLIRIAPEIAEWSGADFEADREADEPVDDFFSRILVDDDHIDEVLAELEV